MHLSRLVDQALYPWIKVLHLAFWTPQALMLASFIVVPEIPLLHMFANARMCFIPYWVSDPQWDSKIRTWRSRSRVKSSTTLKGLGWNYAGVRTRVILLTILFRQSQSSTRGFPEGLTAWSTEGPFSKPNRSFPIKSMLLSRCFLWVTVSLISLRTFAFSLDFSCSSSYWNQTKNLQLT